MRALALGLALLGAAPAAAQDGPRLEGRALIPAGVFTPGPPSGQRLRSTSHGVAPPFGSQPVQGVSALIYLGEGEGGAQRWLALLDNGYGTPESSADFRLRLYPLTVSFQRGTVQVEPAIELRDPDELVPWPIVEEWTEGRPLTGADFDPESLQRAPDGTLWIGEELGPFVLHVGPTGRLLEPPIALPDPDAPEGEVRPLCSPHSPLLEPGCGLRVLQALDARRQTRGGARPPVCAAWELLLDDRDPKTGAPSRFASTIGEPGASSELFDVASLHAAGFRVVPWTVNDPERMGALIRLGVDGLISDDPERLWKAAAAVDLNRDGVPDLVGPDGLLDPRRFEAQGHRGARDLRPENTLPAFEVALDWCMTTLETDCGLTRDCEVVLSHEAALSRASARRLDGAPWAEDDEVALFETSLARLQGEFVADQLHVDRPRQTNDRALSPVAVAFARERRLADPYVVPTLQELIQFAAFYAAWYGKNGQGGGHPDAARRALNARRVRFDVETKVAPDGSPGAELMTRAVLAVVERLGVAERTTLQSFDLASLLVAQDVAPAVETAWLVGDFPRLLHPGGDGASFEAGAYGRARWLAGLRWPHRASRLDRPPRVRRSGGLEGMALSPDGKTLYPLLEQPLVGAPKGELLLFELDLATRRFGPTRRYPLDPRATAIGDFQLLRGGRGRGLVLERDDSEADLAGFKRLFLVELGGPGEPVKKTELLDLLAIPDPDGVAPAVPGDVGLGPRFALPLQTLESVVQLGPDLLVVANDSNYPFQAGRHVQADRPDDTELVLIRLAPFDEAPR